MASKHFEGQLLEPIGDAASNDKLRFTHTSTTGQTIGGAQSVVTIDAAGFYNFDLEYGIIQVEYFSETANRWRVVGSVTINSDITATTITALLNAVTPATPELVLELQQILSDADQIVVDAQNSADAAAQSATDAANSAVENGKVIKSILVSNGLSGEHGFFADGFTLNDPLDVGIDASFQFWKYVGAEALPYAVPQGTDPSAGDWELIEFNSASNIDNDDGTTAQYTYELTLINTNNKARSLLEFIPKIYWAGVKDGSNTQDMSIYIQNAIDSGEHITQKSKDQLTLRMDSPIFLFGGGVDYDFGYSIFTPTDAFPVVQHKVFTENTGKYVSGQFFSLKNLIIMGDPAKRYNTNGAGIQFNKDDGTGGLAVYDGNIENVSIWNMYRAVNDKLQSGSWMTKWSRIYGNFCPIGFAKSVGTTTTLDNCYFRNTHQAFDLQFMYGFNMINCAADNGTDNAAINLRSRVLINDSEGEIGLRCEQNDTKLDLIRIVNSNIELKTLSLLSNTIDSSDNDTSAITVTSGSSVNITNKITGSLTNSGANSAKVLTVSSGASVNLNNNKLPDITGGTNSKILNFGGYVHNSSEKESEVSDIKEGFYSQFKNATLYVSPLGSDENTGLTTNSKLATMDRAIELISDHYSGFDVEIILSGGTIIVNNTNYLNLRKLVISSTDSSILQFNVTGGSAARIIGCDEVVLNGVGVSLSSAPAAFLNGILFPAMQLNVDYSMSSIQIIDCDVDLQANSALTGGAVSGVNGFCSVGLRNSTIDGDSTSTSYLCYQTNVTCQITQSGSTLTNAGLTNGTQITTSNLYF